jgi:hypothetical protein
MFRTTHFSQIYYNLHIGRHNMYYKRCNLQFYEVVFEFHANILKNNLVKLQNFQVISMQLYLIFDPIVTLCKVHIFWQGHKILLQCSVPEGDLHCQCLLSIFPASVHQFYVNILVFVSINPFLQTNDQFALRNIHLSFVLCKNSYKNSSNFTTVLLRIYEL